MPVRGRMIRFARSLQVDPEAEMVVSFAAKRAVDDRDSGWLWAAGLFALVFLSLSCGGLARTRWEAVRRAFAPRPRQAEELTASEDGSSISG